MNSTLLIRLAGPLQSWGLESKFEARRSTEPFPTKSGVIGILAAALGRKRGDTLDDLNLLKYGVRVDQTGVLIRDYHTAISKKPYVTNRYYLSDAVFLAGFEGSPQLLRELDNALNYPMFPLYLGRRACPPEGQLNLGIRENRSLIEALSSEPLQIKSKFSPTESNKQKTPIYLDDENPESTNFQRDLPISFSDAHREYGFRKVKELIIDNLPNHFPDNKDSIIPTTHDPMEELEDN